jgi:predicted nucleic-acid-binding protein
MSSGSLDTNVLLRLLLNDIPEQHQSVKRLLADTSNNFSVADIAIIELVFALQRHYGFTRQQVAEAVTGLTRLSVVNCNRSLFENVMPVFLEHTALSFEDCCLSTYAILNDAEPLWTFDKKLANQAASAELVGV